MRVVGRITLVFAAVLVAACLAPAQQPGGLGGMFGGKGQMDILTLLRNDSVKKELKVTDEQMEKVPAAVLKALGDVLKPEQLARLKQIDLQQRGTQAFKDALVQTALKFASEQKTNVEAILEESAKEQREIMKDAAGGNFQGIGEKLATLRKETNEKLMSVLSADQKKAWTAMLGDEFKIEFPKFKFDFKKGKGIQ